eukprot:jgi/Chlat1/4820/Chrsp31S04797
MTSSVSCTESDTLELTTLLGDITGGSADSTATANLASFLCNKLSAVDDANSVITTSSNVGFLLFSAYLVFIMQAGFACLCAGTVRARSAKNILLKNTLDAAAGAIAFYLFGYAFAYGVGNNPNGFIGDAYFALSNFSDWHSFIFQWAFAAAASTITIGSVAERTQMTAYLAFSFFLTGFVYPVVVHWAWSSEGWLSPFKSSGNFFADVGYLDFAGSGVVHMVGGFAGLVGAWIEGPRIGRFDANGKVVDMPGHSAVLVVLGTLLLWFGWYGFNPGSTLTIIGTYSIVGRVAVTTTLSASAAGVTTLYFKRIMYGQWDTIGVCNGALAGLVAITGGCAVLEPWSAIICGGCAAIVFNYAIRLLWWLKIDDPLDAWPMHGACGAWGILYIGLMAKKSLMMEVYLKDDSTPHGLFRGGGGKLLGAQLMGIVVIAAWTSALMFILFFGLHKLHLLRIPPEQEEVGIDVSKHGGHAYPDDQYTGGSLSKHGNDQPIKMMAFNGTPTPAPAAETA